MSVASWSLPSRQGGLRSRQPWASRLDRRPTGCGGGRSGRSWPWRRLPGRQGRLTSHGARSTRNTLGTLAEVLGLRHDERLPLGSWQDALEDVMGKGRRHSDMPSVYVASERKMWNQHRSKREVADTISFLILHSDYATFAAAKWEGGVGLQAEDGLQHQARRWPA